MSENNIAGGGNAACAIENDELTVAMLEDALREANWIGAAMKPAITFRMRLEGNTVKLFRSGSERGETSGTHYHSPEEDDVVGPVKAILFDMLAHHCAPVHRATIWIPADEARKINELLTTEPADESECMGEDETISYTAKFDNGMQADVKVCGVQYDNNPDASNLPWSEAVLFDSTGSQLCCTEPSDDDNIVGEWTLEYNGETYIVDVRTKQQIPFSPLAPFLDSEPTDVTITVETENCEGERFTKTATAAEWFVDWMGECEMCPANDAPVYSLRLKDKSGNSVSASEADCQVTFEDLMESIRPTMVYHHWGDIDEDYIETAEANNAEPRYFLGKENALSYISLHDVPFAAAVECVGICPECGQPVFPVRYGDGYAYCHHCYNEWERKDLT